ncbi:MAG TPA: hypothetical protein VMT24_18685, partial [Aggregatilineaceae bacterium]|nr:hypothetical protein [Aggregatilineaceae bacterium]
MTKNRLRFIALIGLFLAAALAGCRSKQKPIQVFVTATSQLADSASPPILPGSIATPAEIAADSLAATPVPPTATPTPPPTIPLGVTFGPIIAPQPASAPAETSLPPTFPPGVTYGPIIGPGYTLPPTETRAPPTPLPTFAATAGPSPTPGPALRRDLMG